MLYGSSKRLVQEIGAVEEKPRTANCQIIRSNVPAESVSEYFKRSITFPIIDIILTKMKSCKTIGYNNSHRHLSTHY